MLAIIIQRAKEYGQVDGLIPHLVNGGVLILQYADDTIIFMENNLEKALNMKLILYLGLKINFQKIELYCFGQAKDLEESYKELFGCETGSFPFKYLGIPIHYRRLRNGEWKPMEDRFETKLSNWIGKLWSYGHSLILINSVLTSLSMFMLSFFEIPIGVRKHLDYYISRFLWER
jgi:hypothetical protein